MHPYVRACMPPMLQKNVGRRVEWTMRRPGRVKSRDFFVTITAGEDETPRAIQEIEVAAVNVAPSLPAPEDESAAETAAAESASYRLPDARQPDGSRSLSAGHVAKRTEIGNFSSRSIPPKTTVCYRQR